MTHGEKVLAWDARDENNKTIESFRVFFENEIDGDENSIVEIGTIKRALGSFVQRELVIRNGDNIFKTNFMFLV